MLKEKMLRLIKATETKDYDFLEVAFKSWVDYVNSVVEFTWKIPMAKEALVGDQLRAEIESIDVSRHNYHETAIAMLNAVNRYSQQHLGEPFANIDTNNRYAVADFCGQFVNELFNSEIGGMDEAVEAADGEPYDTLELESEFQ